MVLRPAADGFPVDFTIDLWDGNNWLTGASKRGVAAPDGPMEVTLDVVATTNRLRIHATRLGQAGSDRVLRLAEIELYR